MHRIVRLLSAVCATALVAVLAACSAQRTVLSRQPTAMGMPSARPAPTVPAGSTASPAAPRVAAEAQEPRPARSAVDVYRAIAPSVAYVDTPTGTGSGLLIEAGYLLTNAHVVWPFEEARIVLPDGSSWDRAPVAAADLLVDLALLGPVDTPESPLALVSGEDLAVASPVYVIGYPGEVERYPQPAISAGLISRYREWQQLGITYYQVDATITGGQSGGALISGDGRVIGVSGFLFADTFGLIASTGDLEEHIARLVAEGRDPAGREPWLSQGPGSRRLTVTLANLWDTRMAVLREPPGTTVEIDVESPNDCYVEVLDSYGESLALADDSYSGTESVEVTIESAGPHYVVIAQSDEASGRFSVRSSHPLVPYEDPHDAGSLAVGGNVFGTIDYPMDTDYYLLPLQKGQTVEIVVDSTMIDPYLRVDYWGATGAEVATDDDSGGGLFGLNARLTYSAPQDDTYFVVIEDAESEFGGYVLSVTEVTF